MHVEFKFVSDSIFNCHLQIVEEKRSWCRGLNGDGSVADAVELDAQEADQEMSQPSELQLRAAQFETCAGYLSYLNDTANHRALQFDLSMHLWKHVKLLNTLKKLQNYRSLFDE